MMLAFELRYKIHHHVKEASLHSYFILMNLRKIVEIFLRLWYVLLLAHSFSSPSSVMIPGGWGWEGSILCLHIDIGLDHMTCFEQWKLTKSGSVSVLSPKHYISAHPSCVSAYYHKEDMPWVVAGSWQRDIWSRSELILQPEAQPPLLTHRLVSEKKKNI